MTSPCSAVLQAFLDRSSDRRGERSDQFASNAVLEWFGRTIRGQQRIQQFFRYDVHAQFEQNFGRTTATVCDAFETKPTHLQTRQSPPENDCHQPLVPCGNDDTNVTTPLDRIRFAAPPTPGAPAQGRIFKRSPSIEDVTVETHQPILGTTDSDEDAGVHHPSELSKTPPRAGESQQRPARRPSRTVAATSTVQHSALHYLEATGMVRQLHTNKHQRTTRKTATPTIGRLTDDCSPQAASSSIDVGRWERDVRLRISYRFVHGDEHHNATKSTADEAPVQFALIVYEHLTRNPRTRRNLMADFGRADTDAVAEPSVEPVEEAPKMSVRTPSLKRVAVGAGRTPTVVVGKSAPNKTSSSLKRLRF